MKRLSLRSEALVDLSCDELHSVAGASGAPCEIGNTLKCPTTFSVVPTGCMCTGYYPSLNAPCETLTRPITGTG